MEQHPIQLRLVAVRELHIRSFYPPDIREDYVPLPTKIDTLTAPFNPETQLIQIGLRLTSGREPDPTEAEIEEMRSRREQPFRVSVHILGEFWVDTNNFPIDKIVQWSQVSAPTVLFPFLREHVFGITVRCGYSPLLLPLITVPVLRIAREEISPAIAAREQVLAER